MIKDNKLTRREVLAISGAAGASALLMPPFANPVAMAAPAKLPQIPRRMLGKTGKKVPILLFGGALKLDPVFDPKLAEALRHGMNYFDVADCYAGGTSEPAVGSFLARTKMRDKVWITSKSDKHGADGLTETVNNSLKRLQTDYIDLYFLHALNKPERLDKILFATVEKLKKQGKIKHFGFSCHDGNVAKLLQKAAGEKMIDAIMFRYNFHRYGDKELNKAIDACAKANIGLIAMKTQASAASFQAKWVPFRQTGKWTHHQAVLKAVWADDRLAAAVSHMTSLAMLRQNVQAAVDKTALTESELTELDRYAAATRHLVCDGCDHLCGAKVAGDARIGDRMRYLMYHDSYGEREKARALYRQLPTSARCVTGVDFAAASAACPKGIDIDWHMRRAADVLV